MSDKDSLSGTEGDNGGQNGQEDGSFEAIKRTNTFALPDLAEGVLYKYEPFFGRFQLMKDSAEAAGNAVDIVWGNKVDNTQDDREADDDGNVEADDDGDDGTKEVYHGMCSVHAGTIWFSKVENKALVRNKNAMGQPDTKPLLADIETFKVCPHLQLVKFMLPLMLQGWSMPKTRGGRGEPDVRMKWEKSWGSRYELM
jgi:hypothetical protein